MEDFVRQAPIQAMKNREKLSGACSCYQCLAEFNVSDIKEWTDGGETALCPECHVDSVITTCDIELLKKIRKYWFD